MILRKIECSDCKGHPVEWTIHDLTLEKINLLVGKNASGKTHAINCITRLGDFLTGHQLDGPVSYGV
jgi:ABC-type phosphate transport system ATPase subunit